MSFDLQGTDGFEKQMERLMELTAYQVKQMKEQKEKFYLLNDEPECTNVIFWYVPERLRPKQCPQYGTRDWQLELGNVSGDWGQTKRRLNAVNSVCILVLKDARGIVPED